MATSHLTDALLPQETEPLVPNVQARSSVAATTSDSTASEPTSWASLVNSLYTGASNLANLLPTGTFLAFTAVAPIITNNGTCDDASELDLTISVLAVFALFCVVSCFTDSYQAADGKVYYGLVTCDGLWTPQLPEELHPGDNKEFELTWTDCIHAVLSLTVFAACALMTPTIRDCFYPNIADNVVRIVPAVVGFFVSALFVTFPSTRHGIGFPVSPAAFSFASREIAIQQKRELLDESGALKGTATTSGTNGV